MSKAEVVTKVNFILENDIKILKGLPLIEITKLKTHPHNIKKHPEEQIKNLMELMKMVGFKDPLVIDKKCEIKAGHGRLEAAINLGMTRVPYIPLEGLTKKQMDLFMYMDNQVNESPWIDDNVQLLLEDIPVTDLETFDVNWDDIIIPEINDEAEEIPEPPADPKAKLGDVYQLGNHRIMCGDSTKDLDKLMTTKAAIGFTSPPYNAGSNSLSGNTTMRESRYVDNIDDGNWLSLMENFTKESLKYVKFLFVNIQQLSGNKFDFIEYLHLFKNHFVDEIIWAKNKNQMPAMAKNTLNSRFEHIFIYSPHNLPNRTISTGNFRGTVPNWYESNGQTKNEYSKIHAATFPIHLPTFFLINFSKTNDIVLDPFLGTGTTLIACEQTNRICYGMEIDPAYIDVIIQRWEIYTGKKAMKV